MKIVRNNVLAAILLVATFFATGQHFPSRQYMTSDGMPSNSVFDIAQTSSGVMWFITKSGPTYYDATSWVQFSDSLQLPSSIQSKIRCSGEIVWVAGMNKTAFTIQYNHAGTWFKLDLSFLDKTPRESFAFDVKSAEFDATAFLSFGNNLYKINVADQSRKEYTLDSDIQVIKVINEQVYVGTSTGLFLFEDGNFNKIPLPYDDFPNSIIMDLVVSEEKLHLLGYDWYAELEENQIKLITRNIGMISASLRYQASLAIDQFGTAFFGAFTTPRFLDRETNEWHSLLIDGQVVNIGSTRIFCDIENNIWVSDSRGLFKFNVMQFVNYNQSSGLIDNEVTVIRQFPDGKILLANPMALNVLGSKGIQTYPFSEGDRHSDRILDAAYDSAHKRMLLTGNAMGLFVFDSTNPAAPYRTLDATNNYVAVEAFKDQIYTMSSRALFRLSGDKLVQELAFSGIRNMAAIGDRLYLLSNYNGVTVYDGSNTQTFTSENFDLSSVFAAVNYKGQVLLGTRDGIGTIKESGLTHWDEVQIKSPVYGLLVDTKQRLWIGTDQGIYLYSDEELIQFDQKDGLSGSEINRNALAEDNQGKIWIGTEKGVSVYQNEPISDQQLNLKVHLENVKTSRGQNLSALKDNAVPFDLNTVYIDFRSYSYVAEEQVNFRYRLSGTKSDWILRSNATNQIVFNNLQPGKYKFEIQARLRGGKWGPSTFLEFSIQSPFYRQAWFILLAAFLLIVTVRLLFHYRYIMLIRKQRNLKELVAQRTEEIALLNQQLEEKVKKRTAELMQKNVTLEEYAYINAHHLRGPLTKIMSAVYVAENVETKRLDKDMIKILKDAAEELDEVIYSINGILKSEE